MAGNEENEDKKKGEDEPLELVPIDEEEPPKTPRRPLPPLDEERGPRPSPGGVSDEPVRTAKREKRQEEEEKAARISPPRFALSEMGRIALWPLRGDAGQNLAVVFSIFLVALILASLAGALLLMLPIVGLWLAVFAHLAVAVGGFLFLLEFAHHLVVAALRGRLEVQRVFVTGPPRDGLRLFGWLVIYELPAVLAGIGTGSRLLAIALGVAGWFLVPAAEVLVAATDNFLAGNPFTAARLIHAAGRSWFVIAVPLIPFLIVRLFATGGVFGLVLEAALATIYVYTLLLAALLARSNAGMQDVLLDAGSLR